MSDEVPGNGDDDGDDAPEADGGVASARMDEVVRAFAHRTRRLVLYKLRDDGTATVEELVGHVAALESPVPSEEVSDDRRDQVRTALYHNHLPRLDDAGLIEYDRQRGTVRYDEPRPFLDSVLGLLAQLERVAGE